MIFDTALCFPETRSEPFSLLFLPLFFDTLLYFTPTTLRPAKPAAKNNQAQVSFRNPFADDRDSSRFDLLAAELGGRGREYYRHYLSAEPQSGGGSAEESSISTLISLLTGQKPEQNTAENQQRERYWHARLVLLLSTLLAEEEADIAKSLQDIATRKRQMLTALQGTEEEFPSNADQAEQPNRPFYPDYSPQQLKNLLQAFATFYLTDAASRNALPCTAHSAGADLLFELYEKISRQPAIELASLRLPAMAPVDAGGCQAYRLSFRQQTAKTRQTLCGLLQECTEATAVGENLQRQVQQEAASFNAITGTAAKGQGAKLAFYLLPAMSLSVLFRTAFPQAALDAPETANGTNGVLALLSPL